MAGFLKTNSILPKIFVKNIRFFNEKIFNKNDEASKPRNNNWDKKAKNIKRHLCEFLI